MPACSSLPLAENQTILPQPLAREPLLPRLTTGPILPASSPHLLTRRHFGKEAEAMNAREFFSRTGRNRRSLPVPPLVRRRASSTAGQWRSVDGSSVQQAAGSMPLAATTRDDQSLQPVASSPQRSPARVSAGPPELPAEHGQLWREYDISPYTLGPSTNRPEQAIVD